MTAKATKMQKQAELETLKKQALILQKKYKAMQDNINQIECDIELPALKKKYEGKYFKYKNSYSGGDNWWLYSKCVEVKATRVFIRNHFQTDTMGKCDFEVNSKEYSPSTFQVQITKKEYNAALKKFCNQANKLL
jgi:hypothetical protein